MNSMNLHTDWNLLGFESMTTQTGLPQPYDEVNDAGILDGLS